MDYQQLIDNMSPETYRNLKRALELGKWPDGKALTQEQRHNTMQAVFAWGEKHLPHNERVGYIDKGRKGSKTDDDSQETPLNWKN
jgi:uncharacterized protein YeaC (DUF1315 family)